MRGEEVPIVYWDTCIFISWLMDEKRDDFTMSDLRAWIEDFDKGDAKLITSVVTRVETLDIKSEERDKARFQEVFVPPRALMVQVTPPIATLAHNLRDYFKRRGEKTLSTPDAIHLATAINQGACVLHTADDGGTGSSLGLLNVDPSQQGHDLEICLPTREQVELFAGGPEDQEEPGA